MSASPQSHLILFRREQHGDEEEKEFIVLPQWAHGSFIRVAESTSCSK